MEIAEIMGLIDDLDIDTADASSYETASGGLNMSPIPDDTYVGRILSADFDKDKDGNYRTPETPVLIMNVEITEGPWKGRRLGFQRVYSKTYERRGVRVSGLGDLLYAINAHSVPTGSREKFMAVQRAVEAGTEIRFRTITRAFDKRYFEDQGGQHMTKGSPAYKTLQNESTVKGFKKFTPTSDNRLVAKGPSGQEVEGRAEINTWLPSTVGA